MHRRGKREKVSPRKYEKERRRVAGSMQPRGALRTGYLFRYIRVYKSERGMQTCIRLYRTHSILTYAYLCICNTFARQDDSIKRSRQCYPPLVSLAKLLHLYAFNVHVRRGASVSRGRVRAWQRRANECGRA